RAADRPRLSRPPRARDPVHGGGMGRELFPAHHRALHRGRNRGRPQPRCAIESRHWRRRMRDCARRLPRRRARMRVRLAPRRNSALPRVPQAPYVQRKEAPGMDHDNYDDSYIRGILNTVKTIAMVGVSANTSRPSYFAFKYLLERGSRMIPVNPGLAGQALLGRKAYAKLADVPEPIDMVDIFRASPYAVAIVEEALTLTPRPRVIWMQLGI